MTATLARSHPGSDLSRATDNCRASRPPSLSFPWEGVGGVWPPPNSPLRREWDWTRWGRGENRGKIRSANRGETQSGSYSCRSWREGLWSSPHAEWAGRAVVQEVTTSQVARQTLQEGSPKDGGRGAHSCKDPRDKVLRCTSESRHLTQEPDCGLLWQASQLTGTPM